MSGKHLSEELEIFKAAEEKTRNIEHFLNSLKTIPQHL